VTGVKKYRLHTDKSQSRVKR